jgi:hypothetical protein
MRASRCWQEERTVMIIAPKYGFVFLSMPKCASTSTEAMLRPYGQIVTSDAPEFKHLPYRGYERFFKPLLQEKLKQRANKLEIICLFREPVDWLHSWYRYRQRDELEQMARRRKNSTKNLTFEEFAREHVSDSPQPFAKVGRQIRFIQDKNGNLGNITLFRYEDYDKFLEYMSGKIGEPLAAPRMNISPVGEEKERPDLPFLTEYLADEYRVYSSIAR